MLVADALSDLVDKNVTLDVLKRVAAISASDEKLGAQIAEIVYEVGTEGRVTVEEGTSTKVEANVTKGYVIDNGVVSSYMIADPETMTTTLDKPEVLIVHKKIDDLQLIVEVIRGVKNKPLLIIADDVAEPVLAELIDTNRNGLTNAVIVKSPRFGAKRTEFLKDIAAFVGTEVVDDKTLVSGVKLGRADKVTVGQEDTIIVTGHGDIEERKKIIEAQLKATTDTFEKEEAKKRLAALTGKAAVIKVGGYSEEEVSETRYRVDDAVFACQAALRGGVVAGGAITPLDIADSLPDGGALKTALTKPFRILLENVGLNPDDYEVGDGLGVNVRTGDLVDLFKAGVIEPADTIKTAIESAVSIAGVAITQKVVIVEEDEDE